MQQRGTRPGSYRSGTPAWRQRPGSCSGSSSGLIIVSDRRLSSLAELRVRWGCGLPLTWLRSRGSAAPDLLNRQQCCRPTSARYRRRSCVTSWVSPPT